jgi:3-phenylpropionate/cinnamic acid dioxygenase small subunit
MELWELVARESIRDLVARYNANGDSGRFDHMLELFADDAVMDLESPDGAVRRFEGRDRIATIFTATKASWDAQAESAGGPAARRPRHHVRHFVATHQIDVDDESHAHGRSYFAVLMPHGLDHWGRYLDTYGVRDGRWVITTRRALTDGRTGDGPGA